MALKSQKTSAPKSAGGGLKELRQRILFVLMVMVIFRAGSFVPVLFVGNPDYWKLHNLNTLILKRNQQITDFNSIKELKNLKCLNLSHCFFVDNNVCKI